MLLEEFFFIKKKKSLFLRLRLFFYYQKLIKHQILKFYGKSLTKFIFTKNQTKFVSDSKFFNMLSLIELRINILVSRMFSIRLLVVNTLMLKDNIRVFNRLRPKSYIVPVNSTIKCNYSKIKLTITNWYKVINWRWYNWRQWKEKCKRLGGLLSGLFWIIKHFLSVNYFETHKRIFVGVLLRKPVLGEILVGSKKLILHRAVLSKIYLVY